MRVNPEKKEEKERVTHALLRATLRLAAAHGFSSLGLREVSRAADIAPTSFYRHFGDMEELGLSLIEDLAGRFVESVIERSRTAAATGPLGVVEAMAHATLDGVASDPELLSFILAERVGAIPLFRAAIERVLSPLGDALESAFAPELGTHQTRAFTSSVAVAAVVLVLHAASQALRRHESPGEVLALRERAVAQIRMLLAGAAATSFASQA